MTGEHTRAEDTRVETANAETTLAQATRAEATRAETANAETANADRASVDDPGAALESLAGELERIVDREIMRRPPGKTFRTMIGGGDRLAAAATLLVERYLRAGWSGGRVERNHRGATWIILEP